MLRPTTIDVIHTETAGWATFSVLIDVDHEVIDSLPTAPYRLFDQSTGAEVGLIREPISRKPYLRDGDRVSFHDWFDNGVRLEAGHEYVVMQGDVELDRFEAVGAPPRSPADNSSVMPVTWAGGLLAGAIALVWWRRRRRFTLV